LSEKASFNDPLQTGEGLLDDLLLSESVNEGRLCDQLEEEVEDSVESSVGK